MEPDPSAMAVETFKALAALAQQESGLQLLPEKRVMVQSRLRPRLRALQITDFADYVNHVRSETGQPELRHMISALTTNVTQFFRETHHFDLLAEQMVPIFRQKTQRGERIRIWSAGCSNGQEPYSIAMQLLHAVPEIADADFRILATDIDPRVIAFAKRGEYEPREAAAVPQHLSDRFLQTDPETGRIKTLPAVQHLVRFRELNLMQPWPMTGLFDVIFCRNVVIYFNAETQDSLWPRFTRALHADGVLCLGHSERIADPEAFGLKSIGTTSYAHITSRLPRGAQH